MDLNKNDTFFNLTFKNIKHIHFVGIGGVSVNSLAVFSKINGFEVTGSDSSKSDVTTSLENMGIKIYYEHKADNVKKTDLVVFSNAVENGIEVTTAKKLKIPTISRAKFLSFILQNYKTTICVSGAHGKTTTTALIYSILKEANVFPSLHLGGNLVCNKKSYVYEGTDYMVCEACEYKDSFLEFSPNIGIILNIAPEHLDYFKTFENVKKSFIKFAERSDVLIINKDYIVHHKNKITFGLNSADFTAKNIKMLKNGKYSFDCYYKNEKYLHIYLNLIGKHNILNALASIATCYVLGIEKQYIHKALKKNCGVERRYQFLHKQKFIVHDYAHHPDEIASSIQETKMFYKNKLLIVFQPHTYSRTKTLMKDFVKVFSTKDEILILPAYSAREKYDYKGSSLALKREIGENATYLKSSKKAEKYILDKISSGYGVLFLGAGDIYNVAKNIAKKCWQPRVYMLNSSR